MECILEAEPLPEITWFQGAKAISLTDRIKMSTKETGKYTYLLSLEISNPELSDGGNYRCNAVNAFGESNANIALNFQGRPTTSLRFLFIHAQIHYISSLGLITYIIYQFCSDTLNLHVVDF